MAKRGTMEHWKTLALADALDIDECDALGLLEALWLVTAKQFPTGSLAGQTPRTLCRAIRTSRDPQKVWDALVSCRLLDIDGDGHAYVHDWDQHCDDATHMAMARARKFFANGAVPKLGRLPKLDREMAEKFYGATRESTQKTHSTSRFEPEDGTPCTRQTHDVRTESTQETHCPPLPCPVLIANQEKAGARKNEVRAERMPPPTLQEVLDFAPIVPVSQESAERFWRYYDSRGWEVKGSQIFNWKSLLGNWKTDEHKYDKPPPGRGQPKSKTAVSLVDAARALGHSGAA